jgi:hypothetical protein
MSWLSLWLSRGVRGPPPSVTEPGTIVNYALEHDYPEPLDPHRGFPQFYTGDAHWRTSIGPNNDHYIYSYPSTGGIVVKNDADDVDLQFLDLDTDLGAQRTYNKAEEDEFSRQLQRLGGKWWPNKDDWRSATPSDTAEAILNQKGEVNFFGWPSSGGVYVLSYASRHDLPSGFGKLHLATDMDHRCELMKEFAPGFFANPEDCPQLAELYSKAS